MKSKIARIISILFSFSLFFLRLLVGWEENCCRTRFNWWFVRVSLVVALAFCPKIVGGDGDPQIVVLLDN